MARFHPSGKLSVWMYDRYLMTGESELFGGICRAEVIAPHQDFLAAFGGRHSIIGEMLTTRAVATQNIFEGHDGG